MDYPELKNDEVCLFVFPDVGSPLRDSRKILRDLLSRYTKEPLVFGKGKHGKPFLKSLHFNISHTKDLLVVAISKNLEVGIDVEKIREFKDRDKLVRRYFSENEQKIFNGLPEDAKTRGFFFAWTQKEAYLKFLGKGVSVDLKTIEVQMDPKKKPGFLKNSAPAFFYSFELEKDYLGCVVTERQIEGIQIHNETKV